ncbi:MAG TPA: hypothetical protein VI357_05810 [Mycobacteriales bacterium]
MTVDIAAPLVSGGRGLPQLCVRHGEPATQHKWVLFRSRPPRWTYLLILFGLLPFAIAAGALQKRVKVTAWPFCPRCARLRTSRLLTGTTMVVVAALAVGVLAAVTPEGSAYGPPIVLAFLALVIAGLGIAAKAGRTAIASGYVAQDGTMLRVRRSHPRFAEHVAGMHGVAQHQYLQSGYLPPQDRQQLYAHPGSPPREPLRQYPPSSYGT